MKVLYAYVLLALALILTAANPALSQAQKTSDSFVAEVDVTAEAVTFQTEGQYAGYTMTVAGPGDFFLRQSFEGNQAPNLSVKTDGGYLASGTYVIELTANPYISEKARAALDEARMAGDKAKMRAVMEDTGLGQHDMVYSMSVGILEGQFLDPDANVEMAEPQGDTGQADAGPYVAPYQQSATLQPAAQNNLPPFMGNAPERWIPASFTNTQPDGSALLLQGFVRPVETEEATDQPLFEAYFQQSGVDGIPEGPWMQEYIEFIDGGIRSVDPPATLKNSSLFDYMVEESLGESRRDIVHCDDVIINCGSLCVGFDCVNGESFGFTTIKLKENNLRIEFRDTSTSASFPQVDWQITANESSNGGLNKYSIEDLSGGRTVTTIEAGAPSNSLYIDDGGRVGFGTSTPVVELHVKDGDSPTLRLEQDGSSGFTAQTFDVAANETNFFIRDVTNGSKLPFRIRPGAPTSSIEVEADGEVNFLDGSSPTFTFEAGGNLGIGTGSPTASAAVHIFRSGAGSAGLPRIRFDNDDSVAKWDVDVSDNDDFRISVDGSGVQELVLEENGNLTIQGQCSEGVTGTCADYVFEDDYVMLTLEELKAYIAEHGHLPNVPSTEEIQENGVVVQYFQGRLLEKIEELVLYTLEQQKTIGELNERLVKLERQLKAQDQ